MMLGSMSGVVSAVVCRSPSTASVRQAANRPSLEPKYRLIRATLTPASSAISRTGVPV
jgi:hypothetical protein